MYKTIIIPPIGLVNLKRIQLLEPYEPECLCLPIGWVVCWLFGLSVCRDNLHFHAPIGAVVLNRSQSIKIITLEFLWMNKIDNIITSKKLLWNYKTCSFRFAEFKKIKPHFISFTFLNQMPSLWKWWQLLLT